MRHSEGNRLVCWVCVDVSSHPPPIPAVPSLSHYHCSKAVQTRTSSYLPRREVAAWAEIWASGLACSLPVSHVPADIRQPASSVSTASAPDVSGSNICPLVANHLIHWALIKPPLCCLVFTQSNKRSEYQHRVFLFLETLFVSLSHSKLIKFSKLSQ